MRTKDSYPSLIKALRVPEHWEPDCLQLGLDRNRVKHHGYRHEAERYAENHEQCVYSVAYALTGIDAMPQTVFTIGWEEAGEKLMPPPMHDRFGKPKRFTRY